MRYKYDDRIIIGSSYDDLVDNLKNGGSGWQTDFSRQEYMRKFSDRYNSIIPVDSPINTTNSESFIKSLIVNKLLCHVE